MSSPLDRPTAKRAADAAQTRSTFDIEQLARLYRASRDSALTRETRELIKGLLLAELGAAPEPPTAERVVPRAKEEAPPIAKPSLEQVELRLRRLVEHDAAWREIEPLAMEIVAARDDASTLARVAELAVLHGALVDAEKVIAAFRSRGDDQFYRLMHPAVRTQILMSLWREGRGEILSTLLFKDRDDAYLQPLERLFIFRDMARSRDPATPYIYFQRFHQDLLDGAQAYGDHVGMSPAALLLLAGRMALDLGHDAEGRELLARIAVGTPERDEALRLLLSISSWQGHAGRSHYVELLMARSDAKERLRLLSQFLLATRELGGIRDKNRPALNEILRQPLEWLSEEPEIWGELSLILTQNRDLEPLLPNLFELFRQNGTCFHSPTLDAALWQGPLALGGDTPKERYWRGVAMLHRYVHGGPDAERSLWEARGLLEEARQDEGDATPFTWRELQRAAAAWVAKSPYVMEADRVRMLEQLRVAMDEQTVAIADIDTYLDHNAKPPAPVLAKLAVVAASKGAPGLESRIILKRASLTHLTNDDLSRLWFLANARKETDLAWRIATVLNARQALLPAIRHAWEISGEKRAHYPLTAPDLGIINCCLKDASPEVARLAHAVMHVGPSLPELLSILDPGSSVTRAGVAPADSVEGHVDRALATVSWLPPLKRRYRFSFEAASGGGQLPPFMQVLPANAWSILVARLSERLGLGAWRWRLSELYAQIDDLIPRVASRQDLRRHSGRVARWLRELRPEQRAAWQDLAMLARSLSDEEGVEGLATLVCRLATVMLPNHYMALTSLQAMRAPVTILWDLERFIVSDAYSEIRRHAGTANLVLVPNSLQRLERVHGVS